MQTVIGLFENASDAALAKQHLISNGFTSDDIDISSKSASGTNDDYSGNDTYTSNTGSSNLTGTSDASSTTGYSSTSDYSNTGNTASSNYATSGNDTSFGDKVSHFFKNLFGSDDNNDTAGRYSHVANQAGSIVTVHAQSSEEAERAADILDQYGAINVDERAADYGYSSSYATGTSGDNVTGSSTGSTTGYTGGNTTGSTTGYENEPNKLNVIKEDVSIGKREVETGGVRLRSRIVERPVEEQLRLREERVTVQRTPVDRPATTADLQNFKEGSIEMTEYAEVADVTKQARIVEEVKLNKEVNERTENISETARDTQVDVENITSTDTTKRKGKI